MECTRAQENFSDYIEGLLSPAMRQVFEQHVAVCGACAAELAALQSVFASLDEGLPTVEPPAGFRASVLNRIREQPVRDSFLSRLRASFDRNRAGQPRRAPMAVAAACAFVALVGVGSWITARTGHQAAGTAAEQESSMAPWQAIRVNIHDPNGILQGVRSYRAADGYDYHVFGLHLPPGMAATTASTYVIQSPDALSSDSALQNPSDATLAWSGSVEPGVSVQVPVAVVSSVPAGSTMTTLVEWTDAAGEHKQVCIVPIGGPAQQPSIVGPGDPLNQALDAVSVAYQTPIVVNDSAIADLTQPTGAGVSPSVGNMDDAMAGLLTAQNLTFDRQTNGIYVVDGQ